MSASALFRTNGDPYAGIPLPVLNLESHWRAAAVEVMAFLATRERGQGLDETIIDRDIAEALGRSGSFVQKGLYALERVLGEGGQAVIHRARARGRRVITFVRGLRTRGTDPKSAAPSALPQEQEKTASTGLQGEPSTPMSFSSDHPLIKRGLQLIPDATPERIAAAMATYSPDWVARAFDKVERRNRKPGMLPVRGLIYVLRALEGWKTEGGPPKDSAPTVATEKAPARPSPNSAAEPERPRILASGELAALLDSCRDGNRTLAKFSRAQLRKAIAEGLVPEDLATTIPPELLERE